MTTPLDIFWQDWPEKMSRSHLRGPGGRTLVMCAVPAETVAWRVLDAQYFGLAQRRERVFVVASADPAF